MSYQEDRFLEIANAIRAKDGTTAPIKATDFAERILDIPSGGGDEVTLEDLLNYPVSNWLSDPDFDEAWQIAQIAQGTQPELYNIDLTLAAPDQDFGIGVNIDLYVGDLDQFYNDCVNGVLIDEGMYNINGNDTSYAGDISADLEFPIPLFAFGFDIFVADLTPMGMGLGKVVGVFSGEPFTSPLIIKHSGIPDPNSSRLIILPYGMTSIDSNAFENYKMTSVVIPEGVTSIGSYAFSNCSSLTSISIPSSVTSIGSYAFSGCSSLTNIIIPDSVTSIGDTAFRYCSSLTSITLPDSLTSIENDTFSNCSSLTSISIPSSVTSIESWAFLECINILLYDFTNHTTVPSLSGSSAFLGINTNCRILVPAELEAEWKAATNWATYADKIVGV